FAGEGRVRARWRGASSRVPSPQPSPAARERGKAQRASGTADVHSHTRNTAPCATLPAFSLLRISPMNAVPAARASQTRSFSTIFLIELWERFGYYGMAAILVLFMVEKLGFGDDKANLVWGAFTALVYAAPAIGGWIGDNVLGTRRTMP